VAVLDAEEADVFAAAADECVAVQRRELCELHVEVSELGGCHPGFFIQVQMDGGDVLDYDLGSVVVVHSEHGQQGRLVVKGDYPCTVDIGLETADSCLGLVFEY